MAQPKKHHDLIYTELPTSWDEGIPLGNGLLGALIWKKEGKLRFSLDRADLWDLRPMKNLDFPEWRYAWVVDQWKNDTYEEVQKKMDVPYDQRPAPTKIPGGALEFALEEMGEIDSVRLNLQTGLCEVTWRNGTRMQSFVHAEKPVGWFVFHQSPAQFQPQLIPPRYRDSTIKEEEINSLVDQDLQRLGYEQGQVSQWGNRFSYTQKGWGGFLYQIDVAWEKTSTGLIGVWSIYADFPGWEKQNSDQDIMTEAISRGYEPELKTHKAWWQQFWKKSSIQLPDKNLEKQWYLEMYKFGSVARSHTPPISLQAVWTADNGKIPPWKGDFHHDLNTQLSYWPAYSGNHLDLEIGFINWLWKYRHTFKAYTQTYYQTNGLNVPGVTTLEGQPMGGWIQYSLGPTVSAWLGHHFYLHWQYSRDFDFLKTRAYPWIKEVAIHLDELSEKDKNGNRKLPLSSSPEIFNNSREAWFDEITNFDLSLIRWTFEKASELALVLGKKNEAQKWQDILLEWPDFAVHEKEGLMFSRHQPYHTSHRHFSHLMAIHPLGLIDWSHGEDAQAIIRNTIANLEKYGPDWWTGYSYSWLGNLKARAFDGEGAAKALSIFAKAFCLPNSFHVNGDQLKKGYSKYTYRPFTLEGNFAFASGIQEMLIQSHTGMVHVFPAIPDHWKDVSFQNLRTVGAFVVSAKLNQGKLKEVDIFSEAGGEIQLINSFPDNQFSAQKPYTQMNGIIHIHLAPGERIVLQSRQN